MKDKIFYRKYFFSMDFLQLFSGLVKHNKYLLTFLVCWIVAITSLTCLIYGNRLIYPPVRADVIGYYMYLPALFTYGDITAKKVVDDQFNGQIPDWTGVRPYGSNKYIIKYPVGWAILTLPFFFLGYVISWLAGAQLDGFSIISLYFVPLAGIFYSTCGVALLWLILRRFTKEKTILFIMCLIATGTTLLHFSTYDSIFSHINSFFLITLLLWLLPFIFEKKQDWAIILTGFVSGLIILTRVTNIVWLITIPLYGIFCYSDCKEKISMLREKWLAVVCAGIMGAIPVFLQMLYWHTVTGHWIFYSYGKEGFDFLNPHFYGVLFSVRAGMFFWTPLLAPATIGIYSLFRSKNPYFTGFAIAGILNLWIISSWWCWYYFGFAMRPMTDSIAVFALGLAVFWKDVSTFKCSRYIMIIMIFCCAWTIWLMTKYWLNVIPCDGVTPQYFIESFFSLEKTPGYRFLRPGQD